MPLPGFTPAVEGIRLHASHPFWRPHIVFWHLNRLGPNSKQNTGLSPHIATLTTSQLESPFDHCPQNTQVWAIYLYKQVTAELLSVLSQLRANNKTFTLSLSIYADQAPPTHAQSFVLQHNRYAIKPRVAMSTRFISLVNNIQLQWHNAVLRDIVYNAASDKW